ncbi:MAG TPA: hypothetical protein VGI71_23035 [Scandinavium sp.]|jgi:hypothetical protein
MNKPLYMLLACALVSASVFADRPGLYQRHQEARDIHQDSRSDARSDKQDCYRENDKSNRDCRRDKRDTKRDGRRDARDTVLGNYSR